MPLSMKLYRIIEIWIAASFFCSAEESTMSCSSVLAHASSAQVARMENRELQEPVVVDGFPGFQASQWSSAAVERKWGQVPIALSDPVVTALFNPMVAMNAGSRHLTLSEYLESIRNQTETRELFTAAAHNHDLGQKIQEELPTPQWHLFHGRDKVQYDDVFSLGPNGTGLPLHLHNLAWLRQLYGQKRFFFLSPDLDLMTLSKETYRQAYLTPPHRWSASVRDEIRFKGSECILSPGEVIIVPPYWYHATENVGEAFAVGGQTMGCNVNQMWSEEESRKYYGRPKDMPDHMGLLHHFAGIHLTFASDHQKLGRLGLDRFIYSREKALTYWQQILELHPLQFSTKQNLGIFGFLWAQNEYERNWGLQWMRNSLDDIDEARQNGELDESAAGAARTSVLNKLAGMEQAHAQLAQPPYPMPGKVPAGASGFVMRRSLPVHTV